MKRTAIAAAFVLAIVIMQSCTALAKQGHTDYLNEIIVYKAVAAPEEFYSYRGKLDAKAGEKYKTANLSELGITLPVTVYYARSSYEISKQDNEIAFSCNLGRDKSREIITKAVNLPPNKKIEPKETGECAIGISLMEGEKVLIKEIFIDDRGERREALKDLTNKLNPAHVLQEERPSPLGWPPQKISEKVVDLAYDFSPIDLPDIGRYYLLTAPVEFYIIAQDKVNLLIRESKKDKYNIIIDKLAKCGESDGPFSIYKYQEAPKKEWMEIEKDTIEPTELNASDTVLSYGDGELILECKYTEGQYGQKRNWITSILVKGAAAEEKKEKGEAALCEGDKGETGEDAYKKYGFHWLLLDWRWSDTYDKDGTSIQAKDLCNVDTGYFCDATQFTIAVLEKAKILKDFLEKNKDKFKCTGNDPISSLTLYDCAIQKVSIKDDDTVEHAYYLNRDDGKLLKNTTIFGQTKLDECAASIKLESPEAPDEAHYKTMIEKGKECLDEINKNEKIKNSIMAEISAGGMANTGQGILEAIGCERLSESYYYCTFSEYAGFYEAVKNCIDSGGGEASCTYRGQTITPDFLRAFYNNVEFKLAVFYGEQLTDDEKKLIMQEGLLAEGIKPEVGSDDGIIQYSTIYELYTDLADFEAALLKDSYSTDFVNDFKEAFNDKFEAILGKEGTISYSVLKSEDNGGPTQTTVENTGEHKILLSVNANDNKAAVVVQMTPLQSTAPFAASNPLFSMPLDGPIGFNEGGKGTRNGYGTSFDLTGTGAQFYFNYYGVEKETVSPKAQQKNKNDKDALRKVTLEYASKYSETKEGELLKISGDEIKFTPSDPVKLEVELEKNSSSSIPAGFLYVLHIGDEEAKSAGTITWLIGENDFGKSQETIQDEVHKRDELCVTAPFTVPKYAGLVFKDIRKGKLQASAILYLPARNAEAGITSTRLEFKCIQDTLGVNLYDFIMKRKAEYPAAKTQNISPLTESKNAIMEQYNLKRLLEMVKEESVCVKRVEGDGGDNAALVLSWNPAAIKPS